MGATGAGISGPECERTWGAVWRGEGRIVTQIQQRKHRVGELRPSQVLHTFGVGAIVDLPNISAMAMGLDDWPLAYATEVGEERLLEAVRAELGPQVKRLLAPPRQAETGMPNPFAAEATVGIPVTAFPRWLFCPHCRLLAPLESGLFDLKVDPYRDDRTRYEHTNCPRVGRRPIALPTRFLTAYSRGHLDEFPWNYFVHKGAAGCPGRLRLTESGGLGDTSTIVVRCDLCNERRQMSDAFGEEGQGALPQCRGRHPHLRDFDDNGCPEQLRTILLGASNSWFGLTLTALSVPVAADRLAQLVDTHWHVFDKAPDKGSITFLRALGQLAAFAEHDDDTLWAAIERKRAGGAGDGAAPSNLKVPEWRVFSNPAGAPRLPDFRLAEVAPPARYAGVLARVVLAERLREVNALIGFTRIASPGDFADTLEVDEDMRAPLTRGKPQWAPAAEVHGEGIFLQFDEAAIGRWLANAARQEHERLFNEAHRRWRRARRLDPDHGYPGLRYVLLHSFAHALMRELALECGYSMASIRERIYALEPTDDDGPMAGVLLYTAAADSEGTLGGLVSLGRPEELGRHIDAALEAMRLCASDPHCAEHTVRMEGHGLHGASCHACLFAPETSCERGNRYLDRSVLVGTVERDTLAFFEGTP